MANLARFWTAADIINQVAVEIGLNASGAPFSDADPLFKQMIALLSSAGQDLVNLGDWPILQRRKSFTTLVTDSGVYDLPADFNHMIPQTAWQKSAMMRLPGSLSPSMWEYRVGSGTPQTSIYAEFREARGELWLYPQPPPAGIEIVFEYVSRGWVYSGSTPWTTGDAVVPVAADRLDPTKIRDTVQAPGDLVLYDPRLARAILKVRVLGAKGFDTTKAQDELDSIFESVTSHKEAAPTLSLNGPSAFSMGIAPLNVPVTGYGT